jgi:hypothetical protein
VKEGEVGFLQALAGRAERGRGGWWLDADWGCKVAMVWCNNPQFWKMEIKGFS